MPAGSYGAIVLGLFLAAATASDVMTRRIPNILTLPAMAVGVAIGAAVHGSAGALAAGSGLLLGVGILIVPFALGGIGGGDVKMMAAVGALAGPSGLLASLLGGMILGGLVAVVVLWWRGRLAEKLSATGTMVWSALVLRSLDPLRAPASAPGIVALPYSVPLALGTVLALSWSHFIGG